MIWKKYRFDSPISKVTEALTLWQTERGIIKISKNTLAILIKLGDQRKGCVFHGQGKLLLDAIVETDEGAVGKSVEKELNEPFLMLGDAEEIGQHLTTASEEDFTKMGYESQQEFIAKADDLYNRFFEKGRMNSHRYFSEDNGFIFACQNQADKLDILVSKGSKLVYKTVDLVFVSNKNRVVLKSPSEVVCSSNGKSVIIKK